MFTPEDSSNRRQLRMELPKNHTTKHHRDSPCEVHKDDVLLCLRHSILGTDSSIRLSRVTHPALGNMTTRFPASQGSFLCHCAVPSLQPSTLHVTCSSHWNVGNMLAHLHVPLAPLTLLWEQIHPLGDGEHRTAPKYGSPTRTSKSTRAAYKCGSEHELQLQESLRPESPIAAVTINNCTSLIHSLLLLYKPRSILASDYYKPYEVITIFPFYVWRKRLKEENWLLQLVSAGKCQNAGFSPKPALQHALLQKFNISSKTLPEYHELRGRSHASDVGSRRGCQEGLRFGDWTARDHKQRQPQLNVVPIVSTQKCAKLSQCLVLFQE